MSRPHIITGLDIGTGSVKIISAYKKPKDSNFEVVAQIQEDSLGVRRGVIIDVPKISEIVLSLMGKLKESSNQTIENVYSTIGGCHIFSVFSHGLVSVSRADQKISEEDIDRVLQNAQTFNLPSDKEILEIFPKEFFVDGTGGIKEAIGMQGVRLEADVLALCGFSPYLKNSTKAILNSGLQINELIPTSLASAKAVLTPREKELGVCVVDIGAGTTGMSVFEEGSLIDTVIFPVGSGHITNDIAVCLKTDIDTAEKIKLEYGSCKPTALRSKKERSEKKILVGEGEEQLIFSPKMISEIVEARAGEIFNLVNKELKKISKQGLLPAGIVLTGGGAKMVGIRELAKKELKLPCRIGLPLNFPAIEDPSLSATCGLIMEGCDSEEDRGEFPTLGRSFKDRLKRIFRVFIP